MIEVTGRSIHKTLSWWKKVPVASVAIGEVQRKPFRGIGALYAKACCCVIEVLGSCIFRKYFVNTRRRDRPPIRDKI